MKTLVVAKVVLVGPDDNVLLLRRSETDMRRPNEFDLPGGHTDGTEYGAEAAARETLEEAGVQVDPRQLALVYSESMAFPDKDQNVVWLFYIGHSPDAVVSLSHEHNESQWTPLSEAISMIDYDRQKRALQHIYENGLLG